MKNKILFICYILASMTITFCANPDDIVELNCLSEEDGLADNCGIYPIPSANDQPIDFCTYVQDLVDQAEIANQLINKQNILIDNRGNQPVIAAPHGASDLGTEDIADKVGDDLQFNSLRFFRFRTLLDANVNRPTNQAVSVAQEEWEYDAASVYHCYREHVFNLFTGNPNNFYVEIHGNDREGSAQRLEIVCSDNITFAEDQMIRDIFEDEIINVYGAKEPFHAYTLQQEPDSIYFQATATRTCGLFCGLQAENIPAIHVEIPAYYRGDSSNSPERANIVTILSNALERIDDEVF